MSLALILDAYRRKHNLSQKQLADRMTCKPAFISQLLSGSRKRTSLENAKKYSGQLEGQVTISDFLGLSEYHTHPQPKNSIKNFIRHLFKRGKAT